jgi:hypothetical protein
MKLCRLQQQLNNKRWSQHRGVTLAKELLQLHMAAAQARNPCTQLIDTQAVIQA